MLRGLLDSVAVQGLPIARRAKEDRNEYALAIDALKMELATKILEERGDGSEQGACIQELQGQDKEISSYTGGIF